MLSIKKATNELQTKQAALDKLNAEKNKLNQSLDDLNKKRSLATRDLAAGDDGQQEIIFKLEGQIAPILLRLEGIETLISEAAKAAYEKELAAFIVEREKQELEKLKAGLPEREKRLFNMYASFCEELGKLQVDSFYSADGQQLQEILAITSSHVGENLRTALKAKGLRPLMSRGSHIEIAVWSHFPLPTNSEMFPGVGPVNALEVAKVMRSKRQAQFEKDFEAQQG